jgi:flavin-dependent dehydrogenase
MASVDVVVAGGGVSGLLLAGALAPTCSVVLLEQQNSIPRNKYWLTDDRAASQNPDLSPCVDARYDFLDFIAYDGLTARIEGSYCLWDTDKLTTHLVQALSGRVEVLTGHRFYSLAYEHGGIVVRANSRSIHARLLVDCMGFGSPLVGAKNVASITGYYILHGCEVGTSAPIAPVGLDNVVIDRRPVFFELFPTSHQSAHAAVILPSHQYKTERPLKSELNFILGHSHYREKLLWNPKEPSRSYFGIIPVGRLHKPAIDRIVFFGEAGQANPATSATGLTRMLKTYRALAEAIRQCLEQNALTQRDLLRAMPPYMSSTNRVFQECLFESMLSFSSDDFRQLVQELKDCPDDIVNDLIFADLDFAGRGGFRLVNAALRTSGGLLGRQLWRSALRRVASISSR